MGKPTKPKKRKRNIRVRTGARVVKKDSVKRKRKMAGEAPFVMRDNGVNIRIKIVPKPSGSVNTEFNRRRSE